MGSGESRQGVIGILVSVDVGHQLCRMIKDVALGIWAIQEEPRQASELES